MNFLWWSEWQRELIDSEMRDDKKGLPLPLRPLSSCVFPRLFFHAISSLVWCDLAFLGIIHYLRMSFTPDVLVCVFSSFLIFFLLVCRSLAFLVNIPYLQVIITPTVLRCVFLLPFWHIFFLVCCNLALLVINITCRRLVTIPANHFPAF